MINSSFCVLPFFSFENSQAGNAQHNIYCCRLQPGTNIQTLRQQILQGQRSQSCTTCWKLEDQGLTSERQLHNSSLDFYWDRDLSQIETDAAQGKFSTRMVKLATSNVCNSTCVTCNPALSSAWAKLKQHPIKYQTLNFDTISHIPWQDIKSLGFVGGEPLLEKTNFEILDHILTIGNQDCFVHIVTNGSISLSQNQINLLSRFKNLNLCMSIDGIGSRFEYLRFPLRWSVLLDNLKIFQSITSNISVSCMVSNLSVMYLDETLDWFHTNNLKFAAKQIDKPWYFSPGNLPATIKQELLSRTRYSKDMTTFLSCGSHTTAAWKAFWKEIQLQDELKKISIADYMPDLLTTKNF